MCISVCLYSFLNAFVYLLDCTGVSKGALSKLVPGKDIPLVCPLCTAYLETNLEEDRSFSIDSSTGMEKT
jgi:hypothetical protein